MKLVVFLAVSTSKTLVSGQLAWSSLANFHEKDPVEKVSDGSSGAGGDSAAEEGAVAEEGVRGLSTAAVENHSSSSDVVAHTESESAIDESGQDVSNEDNIEVEDHTPTAGSPEEDLTDAPILDEISILTINDATTDKNDDDDDSPGEPDDENPITSRSKKNLRRVDDPALQLPIPEKSNQHHFLCVFIPVTFASNKDRKMTNAQLDTWIKETEYRDDVGVWFIGDVLTERHRPWTITIPGDMDLNYDRLPIRTFKMWKYLGLNEEEIDAHVADEALFNFTGAGVYERERGRENRRNVNSVDSQEYNSHEFHNKFQPKTVDSHRKRYWRPPFPKQVTCDWYLKSDPDSYVNFDAIIQRLKCFDSSKKHYFGVVHVVAPNENQALLFGHGGSGYMVSRHLLPHVGQHAPVCLADNIKSSDGVGMEDVLFSHCMRDHLDLFVAAYGHTHTEFVLNFHEAPFYVLNGTRLTEKTRVHLVPPPMDECTLTIHPIEEPKDMILVHQRITVDPYLPDHRMPFTVAPSPPYITIEKRENGVGFGSADGGGVGSVGGSMNGGRIVSGSNGGAGGHGSRRCYLDPFTVSKQAEVRLFKNDQKLPTWGAWQMKSLYKCFSQDGSYRRFRCGWKSLAGKKYYGLKAAQYGDESSKICEAACCDSPDCALWLYHKHDGCWVGNRDVALFGKYLPDDNWNGGLKAEVRVRESRAFASRVRGLAGQDKGKMGNKLVDSLLDLYGERLSFARYADMVMGQEVDDMAFLRRIVGRAKRFAEFEFSSSGGELGEDRSKGGWIEGDRNGGSSSPGEDEADSPGSAHYQPRARKTGRRKGKGGG